MIGSSYRRRAKSPLGTVLIINLLGKGLTPRTCMGDGGSIRWAPGGVKQRPFSATHTSTRSGSILEQFFCPNFRSNGLETIDP